MGGKIPVYWGETRCQPQKNPSLKPKQDDFLTFIRQQQLGKLKVYLGACAGVGKTYQMLIEGNRLRRQVYVRTPSESPIKIDATVQRQITETLEAAQKMGGLVISLKHENVAQALISFVKEYGITHVVLGRPAKKSLRLFGRPLHDELMRELPGVDLVII